jgi:ABC-2 type transport system permease protein
MTRLFVMIQKELLELVRSFKLIWVPLVFLLLGIMQPVSNYYMPVLLKQAGNLPEGAIIDIPLPSAPSVMAGTLSQFGTMGLLVLVLVFMGTVSTERNSGAASLILVKPVTITSFILSKWTAMLILAWGSLALGYAGAWYYTELLIGSVPPGQLASSVLVYGLWITVVMSLTLMFSTLLRSPAGAAFSSLGVAAFISLLASLLPKQAGWIPGALGGFAANLAANVEFGRSAFGWSLASSLIVIAAALLISISVLRASPAID